MIGIGRVANHKRVAGATIGGASEIKSTFRVENGKPGFVNENGTCISKLNAIPIGSGKTPEHSFSISTTFENSGSPYFRCREEVRYRRDQDLANRSRTRL